MQSVRITALVLTLLFLAPVGLNAQALTTSDFVRGGSSLPSVTLTLPTDYNDYNTTIDYPADEVLTAALDITPEAYNGQYAEKVYVDLRNNSYIDWAFDGTGYGAFGQQTRFEAGRTSHSFAFENANGGTEQTTLLLPANATVTDASVNISGRPAGTDELEDSVKASVPTNEGSRSIYPYQTVGSDGTVHVVWTDDGDFYRQNDYRYDVFYNSWDGSQWSGLQQLSLHNYSVTPYPSVAVAGDYVYAAWNSYRYFNGSWHNTIDLAISSDGGATWSEPQDISDGYAYRWVYSPPVLVADGSDLYATWYAYTSQSGTGEYDVFFRASDDNGATWGDVVVISPENKAGDQTYQYSMYPDMAQGGSTLYIVWYDSGNHDGDGTADYDIVMRSSSDGGQSWSTVSVVSTSSDYAYDGKVAADGSNNVHVVWREYDSADRNYTAKYRKSTNGGTTWQTEQILSNSATDYYPLYPDVTLSGNTIYAAWQQRNRDNTREYQIKLRVSTDGGNSWSTPKFVNQDEFSTFRERVRLTTGSDGSLWAVWTDEQNLRQPNSDNWYGNERDIWVRRANSGASAWDDPMISSEEYYEADSWVPRIAADQQGDFYLVYWDGGDNGGNGNRLNSYDGDFFLTRSTDSGRSWMDPFVITQREGDSRNPYSFSYMPAVAAGEDDYVYVLWYEQDYNRTDGNYSHLFVRVSSDSGVTWGAAQEVYSGNSYPYDPQLATSGDNVYLIYRYYQDSYYKIFFKRSTDRGQTWSDPQVVNDVSASYLSLSASGDNVVVGWAYYSRARFALSTDGGESFAEEKQVETDQSVSYPKFKVDSGDLYLVWRGREESSDNRDDIVFMRSSDLGETWDDPVLVSHELENRYAYQPDFATEDGMIYVTYLHYNEGDAEYDVYFSFSPDYGETWDIGTVVSDGNNQDGAYTGSPAAVAVNGPAAIAWVDRNTKQNHYEIWTRTTRAAGYPDNPQLDIGGDEVYEWSYSGELNRTNSPLSWSSDDSHSTKSLTQALNEALQQANTFVDDYGTEMAQIVIQAASDSEGRLLLNHMTITYDVTVTISNFKLVRAFQRVSDKAEGETASAPLALWATSPGRVRLSNLNLETADARLELNNLAYGGDLLEGRDLVLNADVTNTGTGSAEVTVKFWAAKAGEDQSPSLENTIKDVTIEVSADGNPVTTPQITWRDIPAGNYNLYAKVATSDPEDVTADNDQDSLSLDITETHPDIAISTFDMEGEAMEGGTARVRVIINNQGDKRAEVQLMVRESSRTGKLVDEYVLPVPPEANREYVFDWNVTSIEKLVLVATELQEGQSEEAELMVQVKKLPDFKLVDLSWSPQAISEGTRVNFNLTWEYLGDIPVNANVELLLEKGRDKEQLINENGVGFTTGNRVQAFHQEVVFDPFHPIFGDDLVGDYLLKARVFNVIPKPGQPTGLWDSNKMEFNAPQQVLTVNEPPDLDIIDLEVAPELEGGTDMEVRVTLRNSGGSMTSGKLKLFVFLDGTKPSFNPNQELSFEIEAGDSKIVGIPWEVPKNFDGSYSFKVEVTDLQPPEGEFANSRNEREVSGIQIEGNIELGSNERGIPFWFFGVIGAMILGMGGLGFVFLRSTSSTPSAGAGGVSQAPGGAPAPAGALAGPGGQPAQPEAAPTPAAAVTLPCPACNTTLKITSTQRPIIVACPSCSTKLKLES